MPVRAVTPPAPEPAVAQDGVAGGDAEPVPALLGLRPVGVEDAQRKAVRVEGEQPVGPHAAVAVAEPGRQLREAGDGIGEVEDQVVVPERLVLDQVKERR